MLPDCMHWQRQTIPATADVVRGDFFHNNEPVCDLFLNKSCSQNVLHQGLAPHSSRIHASPSARVHTEILHLQPHLGHPCRECVFFDTSPAMPWPVPSNRGKGPRDQPCRPQEHQRERQCRHCACRKQLRMARSESGEEKVLLIEAVRLMIPLSPRPRRHSSPGKETQTSLCVLGTLN